MLSVILMILKVIGIILAVLLGIILLITAAVLWVPVRYRIYGSKEKEIYVKVKFAWLLRLIYVTVFYYDNKLRFILRVAGIPFYDSKRPKKAKKSKVKKNKIKVVRNKKSKNETKIEKKQTADLMISKENQSKSEIVDRNAESNHNQENVNENDTIINIKKNHGMKYQIQQIIKVILSIPRRIKNFFSNMKCHIKNIKEKILQWIKYPYKIKELLTAEENKAAFAIILKTVKDLLKHARPRKTKGYIIFGLDDPCSTGQVLGIASIAYAYLGIKDISVTPDFTQAVFEGEIIASGLVRTFTVLKIVIRLIRDENFKIFKKRMKEFKEE